MRRLAGLMALTGSIVAGAQAVSTFYTFTPSASPDVERHVCDAYERHVVEIPCPAHLLPGPCYGTSPPRFVACPVDEGGNATAPEPSVGQVIFGCIYAVDFAGNRSACVSEESD